MKLNNSTIRAVRIDPACLGDKLRLCEIRPVYEWADGKRTDKLTGYAYTVMCPALAYEKLSVKIAGKQRLAEDAIDHVVEFDGMAIGIYERYGDHSVNLTASAQDIAVIA